jgi:hypothetical protein
MPTLTFMVEKPCSAAQVAISAARSGATPEMDHLGGDKFPHRAAEQAVDGQADGFAEDVPECHLERRLSEGMTGERTAQPGGQRFDVTRVVALEDRREDGANEVRCGDLIFTAPAGSAGDLAEADDSLIGVHFHQQERRFGMIASLCPDGKFRPNGHADWDRFDAGDPHGVEFRARQDQGARSAGILPAALDAVS